MARKHFLAASLALLSLGVLAGCAPSGESASRAARQPSWDAAADPFVVPGWKSGDKASWQAQLDTRAQGQNEYARIR